MTRKEIIEAIKSEDDTNFLMICAALIHYDIDHFISYKQAKGLLHDKLCYRYLLSKGKFDKKYSYLYRYSALKDLDLLGSKFHKIGIYGKIKEFCKKVIEKST